MSDSTCRKYVALRLLLEMQLVFPGSADVLVGMYNVRADGDVGVPRRCKYEELGFTVYSAACSRKICAKDKPVVPVGFPP